ncbi:MAG: hypothetical protein JWR75_958 [Devosia sp.]|nr:hypothetical protein [Devosia sp.]
METYDSKKTTTEVSGANRKSTNFRVLLISLLIVVVAFAVIYFVFSGQPSTVTTVAP